MSEKKVAPVTTHCWTASHISRPEQLKVLKYTIESIIQIAQIQHHWISISGDVDAKSLGELYRDTACVPHIFVQKDKMKQFDHLSFINGKFDGDPLDLVYFCDDDDVFLYKLDITEDVETVQGIQFVPDETACIDGSYDASPAELIAMINTWGTRWSVQSDFSGYAGRAVIVHEYFKSRVGVQLGSIASLEDIKFMKYLDTFRQLVPEYPLIFHRINCNAVGTWKENLVADIKDEIAMFRARLEKIKSRA